MFIRSSILCQNNMYSATQLLFMASCVVVAVSCKSLRIREVQEINTATGRAPCVRIKGEKTVTTTSEELAIAQDLMWAARSVGNDRYTKSDAKQDFTAEFQQCINALKKTAVITISKEIGQFTITNPEECSGLPDIWKVSV